VIEEMGVQTRIFNDHVYVYVIGYPFCLFLRL
jgi:hypothetical protein